MPPPQNHITPEHAFAVRAILHDPKASSLYANALKRQLEVVGGDYSGIDFTFNFVSGGGPFTLMGQT